MAQAFKLTVAYDGTNYSGWQTQINGPSIQDAIELAINKVTGEAIKIEGSGRTDAGVHAWGQVASFTLQTWNSSGHALMRALTTKLPRDIVVVSCQAAQPLFHARKDALSKRYRYTIRNSKFPDPLRQSYQWWIHRHIDIELMRAGAKHLVGLHDFMSFQTTGSPRKKTVRNVYEIAIEEVGYFGGREITIEVEANGFLYNMVRNIVGTLVKIGTRQRSPEWVLECLAARDRRAAGQTAPARGLGLLHVSYPPWILQEQTAPISSSAPEAAPTEPVPSCGDDSELDE